MLTLIMVTNAPWNFLAITALTIPLPNPFTCADFYNQIYQLPYVPPLTRLYIYNIQPARTGNHAKLHLVHALLMIFAAASRRVQWDVSH